MFGFIKKCFFTAVAFSSCNTLNTIPLKCVSMNNQEFKVRRVIMNINCDKPSFYPYSVEINKCNIINNPYAKLCVPDAVKNINVKLFNLMSRTNETRHIKWHKIYKSKCILEASVCNNKQRWNSRKCRCECKELIDKRRCNKGLIWNPSNYEYECDKSCDVGEYLDYTNCQCRKRLIDKLVEECSKNIG